MQAWRCRRRSCWPRPAAGPAAASEIETVNLMRYIEVLEQCLGRKAQLEMLPMQPGLPERHGPRGGSRAAARL